jgi:hypothetical protein
MYQTIKRLCGVEPTAERTHIFTEPIACKKWRDRKYLKCAKCAFSVSNETGRPITCVYPAPPWVYALTEAKTLQNPITKERADNCQQFKKKEPNAKPTKQK